MKVTFTTPKLAQVSHFRLEAAIIQNELSPSFSVLLPLLDLIAVCIQHSQALKQAGNSCSSPLGFSFFPRRGAILATLFVCKVLI